MPLENSILHVRVELYNSSFQLVKLKMPKRKLLLNHDSAAVLVGVSFIMCMHILLFLFELSSYVTSFVVGAIVVSFKYIGNKKPRRFSQDIQLLFVSFCLLSHILNTYVSKTFFSVVILKLILDPSIGANLSYFITGI